MKVSRKCLLVFVVAKPPHSFMGYTFIFTLNFFLVESFSVYVRKIPEKHFTFSLGSKEITYVFGLLCVHYVFLFKILFYSGFINPVKFLRSRLERERRVHTRYVILTERNGTPYCHWILVFYLSGGVGLPL